jgi:hypothetical protein
MINLWAYVQISVLVWADELPLATIRQLMTVSLTLSQLEKLCVKS